MADKYKTVKNKKALAALWQNFALRKRKSDGVILTLSCVINVTVK